MTLSGSWAEASITLACVQTLLLISATVSISFSWLWFKIMGLFSVHGRIASQAQFHSQQSQRTSIAVTPESADPGQGHGRCSLTFLEDSVEEQQSPPSYWQYARLLMVSHQPSAWKGYGRGARLCERSFKSIRFAPKSRGPRSSARPLCPLPPHTTPSSKPKGTRYPSWCAWE